MEPIYKKTKKMPKKPRKTKHAEEEERTFGIQNHHEILNFENQEPPTTFRIPATPKKKKIFKMRNPIEKRKIIGDCRTVPDMEDQYFMKMALLEIQKEAVSPEQIPWGQVLTFREIEMPDEPVLRVSLFFQFLKIYLQNFNQKGFSEIWNWMEYPIKKFF